MMRGDSEGKNLNSRKIVCVCKKNASSYGNTDGAMNDMEQS